MSWPINSWNDAKLVKQDLVPYLANKKNDHLYLSYLSYLPSPPSRPPPCSYPPSLALLIPTLTISHISTGKSTSLTAKPLILCGCNSLSALCYHHHQQHPPSLSSPPSPPFYGAWPNCFITVGSMFPFSRSWPIHGHKTIFHDCHWPQPQYQAVLLVPLSSCWPDLMSYLSLSWLETYKWINKGINKSWETQGFSYFISQDYKHQYVSDLIGRFLILIQK